MRLSWPTEVTLDSSHVQLGAPGDVALTEQDAALGIEPGGDQKRRGVARALAQFGRLVGDGRTVQVDDAVDRGVGTVLALHVLQDGPDVVAEVLAPGGLDAGEDDHRWRLRVLKRPERRERRRGSSPRRHVTQVVMRCAARAQAAR